MNSIKLRKYSLAMAESIDAWRIIPRAVLVLYSIFVYRLYAWISSIPTFSKESCDVDMVKLLVDAGMSVEDIKAIACTVTDLVGGPTSARSVFVTTIVGLSTGIFGLYVSTGRRWDNIIVTSPNDRQKNTVS